jgi:NAD(P)-dependent dehydrogenase (short-subunit alcohol dehydrogenase family)
MRIIRQPSESIILFMQSRLTIGAFTYAVSRQRLWRNVNVFGYLGPYTMSKHAMEAYTESLHAELAPLGVSVSVIKPGDYASNIWKTDAELARLEEMKANGSPFVEGFET